MRSPYVISLCPPQQPGEYIWREKLLQYGMILNITHTIPDLTVAINHCPANRTKILLITGGHGSSVEKNFIKAGTAEWKRWVKAQPKEYFDMIFLDCCDSIVLLKEGIASLLNPRGTIVSFIATDYGLRSGLIESRFENNGIQALKNFFKNSSTLLGGSNLALTKRRVPFSLIEQLFFCESLSTRYDSRTPKKLGYYEARIKKNNLQLIESFSKENIGEIDLSAKFQKTSLQLKAKEFSLIKLGLFAVSSAMVIGVAKNLLKANHKSCINSF